MMSCPYTVEFLREKIGPYVIASPFNGNPRLILGLNEVWIAVETLGGADRTAHFCKVTTAEVNDWIDNHYIPLRFAIKIVDRLRLHSLLETLEPSTGYTDPVTGECWPMSWSKKLI